MTSPTLGSWLVYLMREADGALSLEDSLHIILDSMKKYFPCQSVAVILIDDDTKEMRIKIARQISYTFTKSFKKNEPPPIVEGVLHENVPQLFNNLSKDSVEYCQIKLEHEFKSAILVPIIRNQRSVGYVFCDRSTEDPFVEADSLHLQVVGFLMGSLMEKFDLIRSSKKLSLVDDSTQAFQYKAFVPALTTELQRAKMHTYPVTMAIISVGLFRKYVDTYGINDAHALLARVVAVVKPYLRDVDMLARFSADEFILYLSATGEVDALKKLEDIRASLSENVELKDKMGPLQVFVGATSLECGPVMARPLQDLLGSLGKMLMEAKTQRRTRVNITTLK